MQKDSAETDLVHLVQEIHLTLGQTVILQVAISIKDDECARRICDTPQSQSFPHSMLETGWEMACVG